MFAKYVDAYNRQDAAAIAALYTVDAAEVFGKVGGSVSGRNAIQQRYALIFALNRDPLSLGFVDMYAIGNDVCTISKYQGMAAPLSEYPPRIFAPAKGYHANILVHESDGWKIRMAYSNSQYA